MDKIEYPAILLPVVIRYLNLTFCKKFNSFVKYFEKKHKAKIEIGINNNLNLEDYIIEFKSKTKKVLDKIEKVEKLEAIKIDNKKEDNNIQSKNRKIFKKRKFRKKFYKKKTK